MKQKILYGLLALAVSFGLWLYVITVENPNSETTFYNIEVVLENESVLADRGLMVLNDKVPTVTLKVAGNRSYLNKLNSNNITLVADLSRIYESGEQTVPYTISFPGDIPKNSIEILSQLPAQLNLTVVARDSKDIPVNVITDGKVADGFIAVTDKLVQSHKTLRVSGPASLVDEIVEARVTVDIDGRKEHVDQSFRFTYYDKNGNPVVDNSLTATVGDAVVSEIKVSLLIQRYKEVPVVVGNIKAGGGATPENTTVKWDVKTILVAGSEQQLSRLEYVDLGDIDLGTITEDGIITINLYDRMPDGITIMSGVEQVNVTIDLPKLSTKTISFTHFQTENLPAGMSAKVLSVLQNVVFRGSSAEISRLDANKITARVDMSNPKQGTHSYTVTFEIPGFSTVGAMSGTYEVQVEVTATPAA